MESRIIIKNGLLPHIRLDECFVGGDLEDSYQGAGQALIATCGDVICDLQYVSGAEADLRFYRAAVASGCDVWIGQCSCVQFCEPIKLTD